MLERASPLLWIVAGVVGAGVVALGAFFLMDRDTELPTRHSREAAQSFQGTAQEFENLESEIRAEFD